LNLSIGDNLIIKNSHILFNSTTIITKGCINITNSSITVDFSHVSLDLDKLLLINSTSGCLVGSLDINYINQSKCVELIENRDSYSIFVLIKKLKCDNISTQIPDWIVPVITLIVVLVVIIAIAIIFISPLRYKIFPRLKARKKVKQRFNDKNFEE